VNRIVNRHLYSLLFYAGVPLVLLRLLWRARRAPAYARRLGERFGLSSSLQRPAFAGHGIWLHAVSVGEAVAAAPLIEALLSRHPNLPLTITCMTPTGSARIQALFGARFGDHLQHCYLPYDLPGCVQRFLDHIRPRLAVIMETELWPNYLHQCAQRGIPVVLANARLSERSARGYAKFPRLTQPMFAGLTWLAVQSEAEAARFCTLGARPEAVSVTGSIKFDLHPDPDILARAAALRKTWGITSPGVTRPVWIAASTHPGEDEVVLAAHQQVLQRRPDALLILVPRHPERFDPVWQLCRAQGLRVVRHSDHLAVTASDQVFVGDTMGQLLCYYALADLAFVGGSLIARGGHNLLEPIALEKPVLSGPHVFNFLDIAQRLRNAGALQDVNDAQTLSATLLTLWADPVRAQTMRAAGLTVLRANQGALARLLDGVEILLNQHAVSC